MSTVRTASQRKGKTKMTTTVNLAPRPAKPTPSQIPQMSRWKIRMPVMISARPTSSQNQPQAVKSIP
jgi:hypothetical protein